MEAENLPFRGRFKTKSILKSNFMPKLIKVGVSRFFSSVFFLPAEPVAGIVMQVGRISDRRKAFGLKREPENLNLALFSNKK